MAGISVAESSRARKTPKVLHHIEIHPAMGGGHRIEAHHTSYEHGVEPKEFGPDDHEGFYAHIAKHTGRPHPMIDEQEDSHSEPFVKDKEQL